MANFTEATTVVRALVEFFSAHDLVAAEKKLMGTTVHDQLSLLEFKNDLLVQPIVEQMAKRFQINPFDMENVFDLEDTLRKATEQHALFAPEGQGVSTITIMAELADVQVEAVSDDEHEHVSGVVDMSAARGSNSLQTLMRYMQWANHVFYQSCAALPAGELTTNRPMLFDNMLNLLNHVHAMQRVWQAHLLGKPHGFTSRSPTEAESLDFVILRQQQAELDAWYVAYADDLPVAQQSEVVTFEFIDGGSGSMMRDEILHHVVNHASYHRGHVEGVFYQLGVEPPTTDMPVFLQLCDG